MQTDGSKSRPTLPAIRTNCYEVRPAGGERGFLLVSEALATKRLQFRKEHVAIGYAALHSGSRPAIIRIYDGRGELTATHEHLGNGAVSPPAR